MESGKQQSVSQFVKNLNEKMYGGQISTFSSSIEFDISRNYSITGEEM